MVAELAGISVATTEQIVTSGSKRSRPRWIQAATREPVYSVLDSNDSSVASVPPGVKDNVVVISAVKSDDDSKDRLLQKKKKKKKIVEAEQRELPYVWLETDARVQIEEVPKLEVDEEHAIYSVVRKRTKQQQQQQQSDQSKVLTRQQELKNWLQTASLQQFHCERSKSTSEVNLFRIAREMYRGDSDVEESQVVAEEDWKRNDCCLTAPRGVVGLVGPYRIYPNPNERREYMLQEEELIEEIVDSVSVVADREERGGSHQRAKWRIREDDEETLVPELPDPGEYNRDAGENRREVEEEEDEGNVEACKWRQRNVESDGIARENWKLRESDRQAKVTGILSGKEERAVDVPDGVSTASTLTPRSKAVSNEHHEKDSLNETGSTTGGTVEGAPGGIPVRGERNENDPPAPLTSISQPPRSLVSRILARARSVDDLLDHSEPFSQLWVVLSNVYGELVVVLMLAFCLAEVMDTPVPLFSLQGVFMMYLYVGSIAVIISIYLWVLIDSCHNMSSSTTGINDAELGGASLTRFGSLKKAHISRARTAPTSFYIRVGALLFGLATLVFNGLEMAMHSMMQGAECLNDIVFVHPVLHGLFTFLQMHFLFVNSQVLVERFGLAARFGFTHLAATNIAVWVRLVIWDSAQEWTYFVHLAQRGSQTDSSPLNLRGFPGSLTRQARDLLGETSSSEILTRAYQPISNKQISQVVALQECLNTNTLGQLWTSSMPFLYPFIVQFSLIAAAVTFVMGQNVGRNRLTHKQKFHSSKDLTSNTKVGCDGSSKGLFLGILCMVAGIVVILIFLVVREDEHFPPATLSWLTCGTLVGILTLSGLMTASGLIQIRQMSVVSRAPAALDSLLSNVALFGVQLYSIFTIVVSACSLAILDDEAEDTRGRHTMLLSVSILQLVQCYAQSTLIAETSKRSCITRFQMMAKPARQVITFLLFSNAVLWAFDTVITQSWLSQELQLRFFGVLAWGVISRIGLPLLVFYRFHSCVLLLEAWNKCYRMPRNEHPLKLRTRSSHQPHCRRRMTLAVQRDDECSSTFRGSLKRPVTPNDITLESTSYLRPYMDSASWLYLDPQPVIRIDAPAMHSQNLEYAMPPPRRKAHRHHHHHHHHHHHRRRHNHNYIRGKHRRVMSDPGARRGSNGHFGRKQHRRVFSFNNDITGVSLMEAAITEASEETPPPEEKSTSTFRKVPWHPNLHMLKVRQIL